MRPINILVAGQTFQIKSDANEEHVRRLAEQVTERFRNFKKSGGTRQDQDFKAMAMVAITLLDELCTTRTQSDSLKQMARAFANEMISKIDALLDERKKQ